MKFDTSRNPETFSKRSTVFGNIAPDSGLNADIDMEGTPLMEKPFTDLRVDSVSHSPMPRTAIHAARIQGNGALCWPLYELLNKPDTVEIDLKSMTKHTWKES